MRIRKFKHIPTVNKIGKNLFQMNIPQPFYAANNIYVITSQEPTLIDSGYIGSLTLLQRALQKIDLSFSKIRHIFYTHPHIDHMSACFALRRFKNIRMYGFKGTSAAIGNYSNQMLQVSRSMQRLIYKTIQDPMERKEELEQFAKGWADFLGSVQEAERAGLDINLHLDEEVVEGDVISIGDCEIGIMHTPGHCHWHVTPYIVGEGIYFTGDLVLQNISSVFAELDGNLDAYHNSLNRLLKIPIRRLLPAHGSEPDSPQLSVKLILKTLHTLERSVIHRLKRTDQDLARLVRSTLGKQSRAGDYWIPALATMHAIVKRLIDQKRVTVVDVDPPYEQYHWDGPLST